MTFLSYAPNSEDVLLYRALGDGGAGRYLDWSSDGSDVGAVTRALYDRGWSGVAIRPNEAQAEAMSGARPRDHVVALPPQTAPDLPALFHAAGGGEVRVARIAVTVGQTAAVAAVLGLAPWLVLVAAVDDASDAALVAAGFQPALFDGVNQFYVAGAQCGRLLPRLKAPANVTDDYVRVTDLGMAQRLGAAESLVAVAQTREAASLQRMADAMRVAGLARADVGLMADESKWLRGLVDSGNRQVGELQTRVAELNTLALAFADRAATAEAALAGNLALRAWRRWRRLDKRSLPARAWRRLRRLAGLTPVSGPAATIPFEASPRQIVAGPEAPPPAEFALADAGVPKPARPRRAHPVTAVHQFHAGSGSGDAITNGMLLIRRILRAQGFRSDIYVQQRPDSLISDDIRMLDEMPDHADYLLLLHHSMGYPQFDQLAALPAPKILIYHNITPSRFLDALPRIAEGARLGREQLAALRDQVVVALADSDYNAVELQALRFPIVRTCPLLFDVVEMADRAAGPRIADDTFTVLFVGRVTPSKGQDGLVEAFAAFRAKFGRPSRLILVGALDVDEHDYVARLNVLIDRDSLRDHVHLTGLVSDGELRAWYRQADLYVSLSQHEGFGVPLVEAMAHGIPVLAWPSGAVAETLGRDGVLLPSRQPVDIAEQMLVAAARTALRQPVDLSRFGLERHVPVLLQALAAGGAVAPSDAVSHQALAASMHVAIAGHVGKSYSLASVNRAMAAVLERERPGLVRMIPVEGALTDDLSEVPQGERAMVECLAARSRPDPAPELIVSQHYPVYVPDEPASLKVAMFFWEESLVPAAIAARLSDGFDAVFAPSCFVARALVDSGVTCPVVTVGLAPMLGQLADSGAGRQGRFTFLHVSSAFPRKGVDVLLAAWRAAFGPQDAVRLVLKTFPNPHNDAAEQVTRLQADGGAAPVELIDADLSELELQSLLAGADAMVLPTRGEGYNLPAAEAMAAGIPLIVTACGGHMDFCLPGTARLVRYSLAASASHLATPHSLWAEPDVADLTDALREVFAAGRHGLPAQCQAARDAILRSTRPTDWAARIAAAAATLLLAPQATAARIAWISTWDVGCGVAEYSRALVDAMPAGAVSILADDRTVDVSSAIRSWRLGDPRNVDRLVAAVGRIDADVVAIQHQPGLLEWTVLAELVCVLVQRGCAVVVTLHNTRHLVEQPASERATVLDALNAAARVLVHTLADIVALEAIGLTHPAVLLPHAASPAEAAPLRSLPDGSAPVIGSTGFFLPGKGIGMLIQAVSRLRGRWPGIRLRLVNAEYDHPYSADEIAECRAIADREGVEVEWFTAFLPLDEVGATLRGCDLLVLPYEASKESSSAALRTALGTGLPVAVTPLPLFEEASDAVARFGGTDVASVAAGIATLLADEPERLRLQAAARNWLAPRSAAAIATRMLGMMQGLAAQRRIGQPLDGSLKVI